VVEEAVTKTIEARDFAKLDDYVKMPEKNAKFYLQKYPSEIACLGVFVVMIFWLFIGKAKTLEHALKWHNKTLPLLKSNFAYVGVYDGQVKLEFE